MVVVRSAIDNQFRRRLTQDNNNDDDNDDTTSPHTTLHVSDEWSLTSLGLPKREASNAITAMRKTVIFAKLFILFFCSGFCCLGNYERYEVLVRSIGNCEPIYLVGEA